MPVLPGAEPFTGDGRMPLEGVLPHAGLTGAATPVADARDAGRTERGRVADPAPAAP